MAFKSPGCQGSVNVLNVLHMEKINGSTDRCNVQFQKPAKVNEAITV